MIDAEFSTYCFAEIKKIYFNPNIEYRKKILEAFKIFKDFFISMDIDDEQFFTSFYQRLIYILKKHKIDTNTSKRIHFIRFYANKVRSNRKFSISNSDFLIFFANIFYIFNKLSSVKFSFPDDKLLNFTDIKFIEDNPQKQLRKYSDFLRIYVKKVTISDTDKPFIEAETDEMLPVGIKVNPPWHKLLPYLDAQTTLHCLNLSQNEGFLETNQYSIIILEPDYLIDVTDIAECFVKDNFNPYIYFLSKISERLSSLQMLRGNIVNSLFDELMLNINASYDEVFQKALKNKIIQSAAAGGNLDAIRGLYESLRKTFEKIKNEIKKFSKGKIYIEPSFLSNKYGLSGRLDLLIETEKELFAVELKSGKAPQNSIPVHDFDKSYAISVWKNHFVQALSYIMLLETYFTGKNVFSNIFYVNAEQNSIRNVPNTLLLKQQIVRCRNGIVVFLKNLIKEPHKNLSALLEKMENAFADLPAYLLDDISLNRISYSQASNIEKKLVSLYVSFITRLSFHNKIGDEFNSISMSSQWLDSLDEKINKGTVITDLTLDETKSDFLNMHICFKTKNGIPKISSIRKSDMCVVYKQNFIESNGIAEQQTLRGIISHLSNDEIIVSLRNKLLNYDFSNDGYWIIEQEQSDTLTGYLYSSVFSLLRCSSEKRNIILGLTKPTSNNKKQIFYPELTDEQNYFLNKIISANDYFLLQGPPGTGKTRFILRYLVKYYYENTNKNILLVTYTNRAADEICLTLRKISDDFPFLRLGNKETTDLVDNSIAHLGEKHKFSEIFKKIAESRVFVSTIASILTTYEIFQIKNFEIAIIDEASQILEIYIYSLLSKVKKFILIGDEKQLPAVVPLRKEYLKVNDSELKEICLDNLGMSYFERLLKVAKKNGWMEFYGMLTHQARMNKSIMDLANHLFYENKLHMSDYIKDRNFRVELNGKYNCLNLHSVIFIDTPIQDANKLNHIEAEIAAKIAIRYAKSYASKLDNSKIGIITTFRLQGSEIFSKLGEFSDRIDVDTVERFQGSEREIIIISLAVNKPFDLHLISNITVYDELIVDKKLNVALTRAKEKLIIIGNKNILKKSPVYSKMIDYIEQEFKIVDYRDLIELD